MNLKTQVYEKKPKAFSPKIEIGATYVTRGGLLLFLEIGLHKKEGGRWGVPAGKLEAGETPACGARRELFEETRIEIASEGELLSLGKLYIQRPEMDYVYHLFELPLDSHPPVHLSQEHRTYKWVLDSEAKRLPLMEGASQALAFYLRKTSIKSFL